jgi:amino acid permease
MNGATEPPSSMSRLDGIDSEPYSPVPTRIHASNPFLDSPRTPSASDVGERRAAPRLARASDNVKVVHSSHKANIVMTTWNLFNDVISPTVVALPSYCSDAGVYLFPFFCAFYCALCNFTLLRCYELSMRYNLSSFTEMLHRAFGKPGYAVAAFMMFVFNWGGFVGNLVVLGTFAPTLLRTWFGHTEVFDRQWVLCFSVLLFSPIAFYKGLGRFAWASAFSVWSLIFLSSLVIVRFAIGDYVHLPSPPSDAYSFSRPYWLTALGGISFLYTCQDMFFHVFHSLENPTPRRVAIVSSTVMFSMALLFTSVGLSGYFMFFDDVDDNILDNFSYKDVVTNVSRMLIVSNIVLSIPYNNFIPRVVISSMIQIKWPDYVVKREGNRFKRNVVHVLVTTALLLAGLLVAISVTNLGLVFAFVGGVSAIGISLILPPLCYIKFDRDARRGEGYSPLLEPALDKMHSEPEHAEFREPPSRFTVAMCYFVLLVGLVATFAVTVAVVSQFA